MPITALCGLLKLLRNRLLTGSGELYRTVYLGVGVTTRAYGPFAAIAWAVLDPAAVP